MSDGVPSPDLPPRPPFDDRPLVALLDRVERWRHDPRVGLVAVLLVALAAGVVWFRLSVAADAAASPPPPTTTPASTGPAAPTVASAPADPGVDGVAAPTTATPGAAAPILVHVAGAVRHPGVVSLPAGARVVDAIDAAGGAAGRADLDRLNLAAPLADGERVLVARAGDPPTPEPPAAVTPAAPADPATAPTAPVDVNTASAAELETLPGIGPALAAAIIEERGRRGGFASVDDLLAVPGIGELRLADLRPFVVV